MVSRSNQYNNYLSQDILGGIRKRKSKDQIRKNKNNQIRKKSKDQIRKNK